MNIFEKEHFITVRFGFVAYFEVRKTGGSLSSNLFLLKNILGGTLSSSAQKCINGCEW